MSTDTPQWHVIASAAGKILAVYPGKNLAAAQEFIRRTNAQAGQCVTRNLMAVTDWVRPRVGDSVTEAWTCPLCGQEIGDGKPCGCGAR